MTGRAFQEFLAGFRRTFAAIEAAGATKG